MPNSNALKKKYDDFSSYDNWIKKNEGYFEEELILFLGERTKSLYEFSDIIENINVDGIVEMLNKILEDTVKPSSD